MEALRAYLKRLEPSAQRTFADKCGTTIGYLRKKISLSNTSKKPQRLGEHIVIAMERESCGEIRCEQMRPDVDWSVLRSSKKSRK